MTDTNMKEELYAGAQAIELDTKGYLPASGFVKVIDKAVVPNLKAQDQLGVFLPVNVALDGVDQPVECRTGRETFATGCIACLSDRAIVAWMKGFVRLKFGSYVQPYTTVEKAAVQRYDSANTYGVDIIGGSTWSLLFASDLDDRLTQSWAHELAGALRGERES